MNICRCFFCGSEMSLDNSHSYEELGLDGAGTVYEFSCFLCDAFYEVLKPEEGNKDESEKKTCVSTVCPQFGTN